MSSDLKSADIYASVNRQVFFDDPSSVNLTFSNMTHVYSTNYTVRVYTSSCLFYNSLSVSWDSDGCTVSRHAGVGGAVGQHSALCIYTDKCMQCIK